MTDTNLLENQLRELGRNELALENEIAELPGLIREAFKRLGDTQGELLEDRLRQARTEIKQIKATIQKLEAQIYTKRRSNSHDRSR